LTRGPLAPEFRIPDQPRIGGALRSSLIDFFYNSWRLVPANAIWGAGVLAAVLVLLTWPLGGLVLILVLALPVAGIFRLAALIVRQQPAALSDALAAWRDFLRPALITGFVVAAITIVLGTNMYVGFTSGEPLGWAVATAASWGLLATWAVALPYWPLMVDPVRADVSMRDKLRLAAMLVLVWPGRFGALFLLVAALFVVSVVFFAALLTISIAFIALLLAHYTLPAADRFEQRPTQQVFG
jgi:uncharacterized membrane protein YesL